MSFTVNDDLQGMVHVLVTQSGCCVFCVQAMLRLTTASNVDIPRDYFSTEKMFLEQRVGADVAPKVSLRSRNG